MAGLRKEQIVSTRPISRQTEHIRVLCIPEVTELSDIWDMAKDSTSSSSYPISISIQVRGDVNVERLTCRHQASTILK